MCEPEIATSSYQSQESDQWIFGFFDTKLTMWIDSRLGKNINNIKIPQTVEILKKCLFPFRSLLIVV